MHVYGEANRVLQFKKACENGNIDEKELGNLMNLSHDSCRDLYECSCKELDELQACCIKGGALGARLTGAGWGGCVVSLIEKSNIDYFKKYISQYYYSSIKNVPSNAVFETTPSSSLTICTNLNL